MKRFNDGMDMNRCHITGIRSGIIERHHVFGAANRTRSTFYGFVVPLIAEIHPNGARRNDKRCQELTGMKTKDIDLNLRREAQTWYENDLGKTREEFIEEFGRNYLE